MSRIWNLFRACLELPTAGCLPAKPASPPTTLFKPATTIDIPELDIISYAFSSPYSDNTPYLIDDATGMVITRGYLKQRYSGFSGGLRQIMGWLEPGNRLAILAPNSIEYPAICWGTLATGGVVMGLNPNFTHDELVMRLKACPPQALVIDHSLLEKGMAAAKEVGIPTCRIILIPGSDGHVATPGHVPDMIPYESMFVNDGAKDFCIKGPASREQPAIIIFSSGTTGKPIMTVLSHYNYVSMIARMAADKKNLLFSDTAPYLQLPFWTQPGISHCMIAGLYMGYPTVVIPSYDFPKTLELIEKYQLAQLQTTPQIVNMLARDERVHKHDLSSLTHILVAGAPSSEDALILCQKRLGIPVLNNYGFTEATLLVTRNPATKNRIGSVGQLYLNTEAQIIGDDGEKLPAGQEGELFIRAPGILNNYIGKTRAESGINADGFMSTGDMAHIDKDGYIFITDRKKEIFKCQDKMVIPALIEHVLFEHPRIHDCCVVPVWSNRQTTYFPRAYVVLKSGPGDDNGLVPDIQEFVKERVKDHMQLRGGICLVPLLPRHENGKVLRKQVRELDASRIIPTSGVFEDFD
ncbi:hypothetical protein DFS34DRAFT_644053 [Phlyctochytrium arcticum]|nr:hypothetical protein DFS34DRAFT_644053 [Phlyctochytrium arcticum]